MPQSRPYPVSLNITGKLCLVVGGGSVAYRKTRDLLESGARIKLVSPALSDQIRELRDRIEILQREYQAGDEKGALLVFAATDNAQTNQTVARNASKGGCLVNVADAPELCDFLVPSKVKRGGLILTASTSGKVPALTKLIRKQLEQHYPEHWGKVVDLVKGARESILAKTELSQTERKALIEKVVALPLLDYIRAGKIDKAREEIEKCISR